MLTMNKQKPLIAFLINKFSYSLLSIIKHSSDILHKDNKSASNLLIIMKDNFEFKRFYKELHEDKKIFKIFQQTDTLILTQREIKESCDIFPIEYLEMIDSEEALYGKKLSEIIKIENKNLRLQIESNIRRNIILLKSAFIYDKKHIAQTLNASLNSFIISLKNLLRFHNVPVKEMSARDVLIKTADIIELDIQLFFLLMRIIDNPRLIKIDKIDIEEIFYLYLAQVENIVTFVDKLDVTTKKDTIKKATTAKKNVKTSK
ncbi:MAG: hypothetical protein PHF25_04465 [Candidatus Margulisbacteria bacterium]|nr:hypothetical protein [Candidatus Margulisiibacteriota bacterium]